MNPDKSREEAHDMDMAEQRKEWPRLHGDGILTGWLCRYCQEDEDEE